MNIWYMFDNHTFEQVKETDREGLLRHARALINADNCGSFFVRDEFDSTLNKLTLHTERMPNGRYGVTDADLEGWADEIMAERSFRTLMA
jgi:hypothetical protein